MRVWIVSGGSLDEGFVRKILGKENRADLLIGADRGAWFLYRLGIRPDYLIGDFDSIDDDERQALASWQLPLSVLPTHKDDTDTEAALNLALLLDREHYQRLDPAERRIMDLKELPKGAGEYQIDFIGILGATGSRLDHVFGAVAILGQALKARAGRGIPACILDPDNRIRMVDSGHPLSVTKEEEWGQYLSVIPFGGPCLGVTLRGVSYPLQDAQMDLFSSMGVSNEIVDRAEISLEQGCLLVLESQD